MGGGVRYEESRMTAPPIQSRKISGNLSFYNSPKVDFKTAHSAMFGQLEIGNVLQLISKSRYLVSAVLKWNLKP